MKRRILASTLALTMLLGTVSAAATDVSDFSDMPDNYATDSLWAAVENGLLSGDTAGQIMPYEDLTRAQMATILVRAFGGENSADMSAFDDVSSTAWYYDDLSAAVAMGIFQGSGSMMYPDTAITRQEAFVVLSRAFSLDSTDTAILDDYADGGDVATWAAADVAAMVATGYVQGSSENLYPNDTISRQDFAVVMDRMVETYISEAGDYSDLGDGSIMVNTPDVTLSDMTISGDLIIGDGVGDGDITLDNVTVEGHMLVRGGGVNSIIITGDSEIQGTVKVAKVDGEVRVAVEGNASVGVVYVNDGLDDIIVEGAFESLVVEYNTTVYAVNTTIETIDIHAEEAIVILAEGTSVGVATVYETATNAQIIVLDETVSVDTITAEAAGTTVTVGEGATVSTVTTTETAIGATVEVADGATVESIEAAAEGTTITGEGTVESVAVAGDNITVETEGTAVAVADDVSGTVAGGEDVDAGSTTTTETTTTTSSGSSSGSGSSSSSSTYYTVTLNYNYEGSTDATSSVKKSNSYTFTTPTREGHTFLGWDSASDGSGEESYCEGDTHTVTSDITFYAIWISDAEVALDQLIDNQYDDVINPLMMDDSYTTTAYAVLTNWDEDANTIDVVIYDGSTTVGTVYEDIGSTLTTILTDEGGTVQTYVSKFVAENGETSGTLDVDESIDGTQLTTFVKAIFGTISGDTQIEALTDDTYAASTTITATTTTGEEIVYTVTFSMADSEEVLDGAVTANVVDLNDEMTGYAVLTEDVSASGGGDITVSITDGTVTVSTVATDIATMLTDLLNNPVYSYHYTKLMIDETEIDSIDLTGDINTALGSLVVGGTIIADLAGTEISVIVTPTNADAEILTYTFAFELDATSVELVLSDWIDTQIGLVNEDMVCADCKDLVYAELSIDNDAVTVTIYDGDVTVSTVYGDILTTLTNALTDEGGVVETYVSSFEASNAIEGGASATWNVADGLGLTTIKDLVYTLFGESNIAGATKIEAMTEMDATTIVITDKSGNEYTYTVTFVIAASEEVFDEAIAEFASELNEKMTYATVGALNDEKEIPITYTDGTTTVSQVASDIGATLFTIIGYDVYDYHIDTLKINETIIVLSDNSAAMVDSIDTALTAVGGTTQISALTDIAVTVTSLNSGDLTYTFTFSEYSAS